MTSIDDLLDDDPAYDPVAVARIPRVRRDLIDEHAALEKKLATLVSDTIDAHPERAATVARIDEIEAEMAASIQEFKFKGIGRRAWADLRLKHQPTREQARELKVDHNPLTFPYAAVAASCVDPVMTAAQVKQLADKPWMTDAAWAELWGKCLEVNLGAPLPKSLAASLINRMNGRSGERPTSSASPAPSSSDES